MGGAVVTLKRPVRSRHRSARLTPNSFYKSSRFQVFPPPSECTHLVDDSVEIVKNRKGPLFNSACLLHRKFNNVQKILTLNSIKK